jgi:tetratricopeptide (TPR) repeat protein
MKKSKQLSDKELALRKELSKRTVNMISRNSDGQAVAGDPPQVEELGQQISRLISDERLEEARDMLSDSLKKYPQEMGLLSLQMILDVMLKEFGSYDKAKQVGSEIIEIATEKKNAYYAMVAINNLALIAHNEGHDEYSKAMYMAAHLIDGKALGPMRNIAGWYSRRRKLEEAQKWIDKIIATFPEWQSREDITTFLNKDESLANLREYEPFKEKVLAVIKG